MSDVFDQIESIAWSMGDNAFEFLTRLYPDVEFKIYPCGPLILPPNIVTCCASGVGEVMAVKRLTLISARADGDVPKAAAFEEIWTSPNAVPWDNHTWELFFWDQEKDQEVQFKVPVVE